MSRNISEATKKDLDFMKLGKQVQKVIKNKKDWVAFKSYADFYFKKLPSHLDYIKNKTYADHKHSMENCNCKVSKNKNKSKK